MAQHKRCEWCLFTAEDGSPGDNLSLYLEVLFQRGKGGVWIYMIFFFWKKWLLNIWRSLQITNNSHLKLMILALFSFWEDIRICSLWNFSLVVFLNYLGASIQSTCFLLVSILNSPQWVTAVGAGLNLVELEWQAAYFFFTKRTLALRHAISVEVRYFCKWLHGIMSTLIWFPPTSICSGSALVIEVTLVCFPAMANWHWVKESTAFIAGSKQGEWAAHAQRPWLFSGFQGLFFLINKLIYF